MQMQACHNKRVAYYYVLLLEFLAHDQDDLPCLFLVAAPQQMGKNSVATGNRLQLSLPEGPHCWREHVHSLHPKPEGEVRYCEENSGAKRKLKESG
jgi:hypothetical protein